MIYIGVDDGYFPHPKKGGKTVIAAVFINSDLIPVRAKLEWIEIDGHDATRVVSRMLANEVLERESVVLLDGVTYAGFNYIDPDRLANTLGNRVGVIVFFRWLPDPVRVWRALSKNFPDAERRWGVIGRIIRDSWPLVLGGLGVYAYSPNLERSVVSNILSDCTRWGAQPEPLRLAHLVASGVSRLSSLHHS